MYRFLLRPKWIGFHLLVVVGIVTMINLGFWQLRRLDERRDFNATVEARYDEAPVPLDELLTPDADPDALEWRPVTTSGTYLPDEQILIANRSQGGTAGENVVVPLELDDGRILLVNRGFVPLAAGEVSDVPALDVEIVGRLREAQARGLGQLADPTDGDLAVAQRVDIERLTPQLPGPVVPMYVDLAESNPPEGDLPDPVAAPELGERNHLSYAFQWFIFSIAVAAGWVLAVRRSVQKRKRESVTAERAPSDASGSDRAIGTQESLTTS